MICRLCLKPSTEVENIITSKFKCAELTLLESLYWIFGVEVNPNDSYTKYICKHCENVLQYVGSYRRLYRRNQLILEEKLKESNENKEQIDEIADENLRENDIISNKPTSSRSQRQNEFLNWYYTAPTTAIRELIRDKSTEISRQKDFNVSFEESEDENELLFLVNDKVDIKVCKYCNKVFSKKEALDLHCQAKHLLEIGKEMEQFEIGHRGRFVKQPVVANHKKQLFFDLNKSSNLKFAQLNMHVKKYLKKNNNQAEPQKTEECFERETKTITSTYNCPSGNEILKNLCIPLERCSVPNKFYENNERNLVKKYKEYVPKKKNPAKNKIEKLKKPPTLPTSGQQNHSTQEDNRDNIDDGHTSKKSALENNAFGDTDEVEIQKIKKRMADKLREILYFKEDDIVKHKSKDLEMQLQKEIDKQAVDSINKETLQEKKASMAHLQHEELQMPREEEERISEIEDKIDSTMSLIQKDISDNVITDAESNLNEDDTTSDSTTEIEFDDFVGNSDLDIEDSDHEIETPNVENLLKQIDESNNPSNNFLENEDVSAISISIELQSDHRGSTLKSIQDQYRWLNLKNFYISLEKCAVPRNISHTSNTVEQKTDNTEIEIIQSQHCTEDTVRSNNVKNWKDHVSEALLRFQRIKGNASLKQKMGISEVGLTNQDQMTSSQHKDINHPNIIKQNETSSDNITIRIDTPVDFVDESFECESTDFDMDDYQHSEEQIKTVTVNPEQNTLKSINNCYKWLNLKNAYIPLEKCMIPMEFYQSKNAVPKKIHNSTSTPLEKLNNVDKGIVETKQNKSVMKEKRSKTIFKEYSTVHANKVTDIQERDEMITTTNAANGETNAEVQLRKEKTSVLVSSSSSTQVCANIPVSTIETTEGMPVSTWKRHVSMTLQRLQHITKTNNAIRETTLEFSKMNNVSETTQHRKQKVLNVCNYIERVDERLNSVGLTNTMVEGSESDEDFTVNKTESDKIEKGSEAELNSIIISNDRTLAASGDKSICKRPILKDCCIFLQKCAIPRELYKDIKATELKTDSPAYEFLKKKPKQLKKNHNDIMKIKNSGYKERKRKKWSKLSKNNCKGKNNMNKFKKNIPKILNKSRLKNNAPHEIRTVLTRRMKAKSFSDNDDNLINPKEPKDTLINVGPTENQLEMSGDRNIESTKPQKLKKKPESEEIDCPEKNTTSINKSESMEKLKKLQQRRELISTILQKVQQIQEKRMQRKRKSSELLEDNENLNNGDENIELSPKEASHHDGLNRMIENRSRKEQRLNEGKKGKKKSSNETIVSEFEAEEASSEMPPILISNKLIQPENESATNAEEPPRLTSEVDNLGESTPLPQFETEEGSSEMPPILIPNNLLQSEKDNVINIEEPPKLTSEVDNLNESALLPEFEAGEGFSAEMPPVLIPKDLLQPEKESVANVEEPPKLTSQIDDLGESALLPESRAEEGSSEMSQILIPENLLQPEKEGIVNVEEPQKLTSQVDTLSISSTSTDKSPGENSTREHQLQHKRYQTEFATIRKRRSRSFKKSFKSRKKTEEKQLPEEKELLIRKVEKLCEGFDQLKIKDNDKNIVNQDDALKKVLSGESTSICQDINSHDEELTHCNIDNEKPFDDISEQSKSVDKTHLDAQTRNFQELEGVGPSDTSSDKLDLIENSIQNSTNAELGKNKEDCFATNDDQSKDKSMESNHTDNNSHSDNSNSVTSNMENWKTNISQALSKLAQFRKAPKTGVEPAAKKDQETFPEKEQKNLPKNKLEMTNQGTKEQSNLIDGESSDTTLIQPNVV